MVGQSAGRRVDRLRLSTVQHDEHMTPNSTSTYSASDSSGEDRRLAIFVDVQNIYYTCRSSFGKQFDYRRFWAQYSLQGEIVSAIAYATARDDDGQRKFQDALRHIGFEVKLKPFIQRADGSAKGDWDVGITIDVLDVCQSTKLNVNHCVLLSGDGDFDRLLQRVGRDGQGGKKVITEVVSATALTANSLIAAADRHTPIDENLLQA